MIEISESDFEQMALNNADVFEFESGTTVAYDVAGYKRCVRKEVKPGTLKRRDIEERKRYPTPEKASFVDEPYIARLAGFRRRDTFGPDQIGELLNEKSIAWTDGLGNGLFESMLINKKYGLRHVLEAPILGFQTPFLEGEWDEFAERYHAIVDNFIHDLRLMAPIYGGELTGVQKNLVVLWSKDYPLPNFMNAYKRAIQAVSAELEKVIGGKTLPIKPTTAHDRLRFLKFWNWVREKQARIQITQADLLRQALGSGTQVVANPHELPVLDFAGQARAFDIPSVAIRPLLLDDSLFLRHYVAYFSQLFNDLTEKQVMISVRMNLSAATPQFVPSGELIRFWYDQAVRHGAGSFYFWTRDYPTNDDPATYDGPIPGNPISSTLPEERWETSLEILGRLSTQQRFVQPQAEVAILVPIESALLTCGEWRRIYATFSVLAEKQVFTRFITDRQIEDGKRLEGVKMVIAPELEFLSPELQKELENFTQSGGLLLTSDAKIFDQEGNAIKGIKDIEKIERSMLDVFPMDGDGNEEKHSQYAELLWDYVEKFDIDPKSWVFQVQYDNLPKASWNWLRKTDPSVYFAPWQYEHGSEWIMPYVKEIPETGK